MLNKIIIIFINIYRYFLSPLFFPCCRFYPSCSAYARDSFQSFGLFKASFLTIKRLLRCNPFFLGGFDPVPKNNKIGKYNG